MRAHGHDSVAVKRKHPCAVIQPPSGAFLLPGHSSTFAVFIMRSAPSEPRLLTLILLSALAILPINFFLPSLPSMAIEFDVTYSFMGLSLVA